MKSCRRHGRRRGRAGGRIQHPDLALGRFLDLIHLLVPLLLLRCGSRRSLAATGVRVGDLVEASPSEAGTGKGP